jgi:hypothetical protein
VYQGLRTHQNAQWTRLSHASASCRMFRRFSDDLATSPEDQRLPASSQAVQRQRWGRGCEQAEPEEDQPNKCQKSLVEATTRTTSRTVLLWVQSLLSLQHQFHKTSHSRERQGPSSCQLHLYIEREIQAVVNSGDKTVDAAIQLRSRGPAKNAALISPDHATAVAQRARSPVLKHRVKTGS